MPDADWVRVLRHGEHVGWLPFDECVMLGLRPGPVVQDPAPIDEDPWVINLSELAYSRGCLSGDVNLVQERLLISVLNRRQEKDRQIEQARFEGNLLIHRPEAWERLQIQKRADEIAKEVGEDIEWRAPGSVAELQALIQEFEHLEEEGEGPTEERYLDVPPGGLPEGAVMANLTEEELRELGG